MVLALLDSEGDTWMELKEGKHLGFHLTDKVNSRSETHKVANCVLLPTANSECMWLLPARGIYWP